MKSWRVLAIERLSLVIKRADGALEVKVSSFRI